MFHCLVHWVGILQNSKPATLLSQRSAIHLLTAATEVWDYYRDQEIRYNDSAFCALDDMVGRVN